MYKAKRPPDMLHNEKSQWHSRVSFPSQYQAVLAAYVPVRVGPYLDMTSRCRRTRHRITCQHAAMTVDAPSCLRRHSNRAFPSFRPLESDRAQQRSHVSRSRLLHPQSRKPIAHRPSPIYRLPHYTPARPDVASSFPRAQPHKSHHVTASNRRALRTT